VTRTTSPCAIRLARDKRRINVLVSHHLVRQQANKLHQGGDVSPWFHHPLVPCGSADESGTTVSSLFSVYESVDSILLRLCGLNYFAFDVSSGCQTWARRQIRWRYFRFRSDNSKDNKR
jgi:hypothetical protein